MSGSSRPSSRARVFGCGDQLPSRPHPALEFRHELTFPFPQFLGEHWMSSSSVERVFRFHTQAIRFRSRQLPLSASFIRDRNPEPAVGAMAAGQALGRPPNVRFADRARGTAMQTQELGHRDLVPMDSRRRLRAMVEGETGARTIGSRAERFSACYRVGSVGRDRQPGSAPRRPCGLPAGWGFEHRWGRRV